MRNLVTFLLLMFSALGFTQSPSTFLHVRPDVTVLIQKHATGANMVEITMRDPQYPPSVLEAQCNNLCSLIGAPARGLSVVKDSIGGSSDPNMAVIRATFATDGLIEPDGALRIEPVLKAMAGVPAPFTLHGVSITFEDMSPNSHTVQQLSLPNVLDAEARYTPEGVLKGTEYRVQLLTQDPDKIKFPDHYEPPPTAAKPQVQPQSNLTLILGLIMAGIAAGALVYFGMLRNGSKGRP